MRTPATRGEFRLRASGWDDTEPAATQTGRLDSGKRYTVVALRDAEGNLALNVIADNLAPPSEGKAKVRIINAASNFGAADVIRQNDNKLWFKSVNIARTTDYEDATYAACMVPKIFGFPPFKPHAWQTLADAALAALKELSTNKS